MVNGGESWLVLIHWWSILVPHGNDGGKCSMVWWWKQAVFIAYNRGSTPKRREVRCWTLHRWPPNADWTFIDLRWGSCPHEGPPGENIMQKHIENLDLLGDTLDFDGFRTLRIHCRRTWSRAPGNFLEHDLRSLTLGTSHKILISGRQSCQNVGLNEFIGAGTAENSLLSHDLTIDFQLNS